MLQNIHIIILTGNQISLKNEKNVGLLMALKKNENKGDVKLTLSQNQTNNSLNIYDCNPLHSVQ